MVENQIKASKNAIGLECTHCGEDCTESAILDEKNIFCCHGCQQIFYLLKDNNLENYYKIASQSGISKKNKEDKNYDYLDDEEIIAKLLDFHTGNKARVQFTLPDIHCSSCIWLLENIHKLDPGIQHSKVNFLEKKAYINFDTEKTSLKSIVLLLQKIGYHPELNFSKIAEPQKSIVNRSLILKIGVAGFAFGNIMLISFPEYLGFEKAASSFYLGYINLFLALPVLFYSGFSYLESAWYNIKVGKLGIHVPVAIGMLTLFGRSAYEILNQIGEGYLDSFAGFVLFLLIGKWFQDYTFQSIAFDRNYKSYFPISVQKYVLGEWQNVSINTIKASDQIRVRNGEIIPCDGTLISDKAKIDYSFVTGESEIILVSQLEQIFAGGKQIGPTIDIKVTKPVDQSYLTQLWNEKVFKLEDESKSTIILNKVSAYFTITILIIAAITFLYWFFIDKGIAFRSITAVLIVACPCALALSVPFILGNATRILAKLKFYVRNTTTLEKILDIDTYVFDKTGTITDSKLMQANYDGQPLSSKEMQLLYSLVSHSNHPLSQAICKFAQNASIINLDYFEESIGLGLIGKKGADNIKLGSISFILGKTENFSEQTVLLEINHKVKGHFSFHNPIRQNIDKVLNKLSNFNIELLSGDNEKEKARLQKILPNNTRYSFNQNPSDKLKHIQKLQDGGYNVMMIGDGLNDAGALQQSNVGIAIADEGNNFSPGCDVIISGSTFSNFIGYINYIKSLRYALYGAFVIAFMYNLIGLGFAVTGNLSPLVAAILMPTSSITIMIYGLGISKFLSFKLNSEINNYKNDPY